MSATLSRVRVDGGDLAVGTFGEPTAPAVLAIHGITASHLAFSALARDLPGLRVVAPDLRGRGGSNGLPGPFGLRQHAADLAAVLAGLGPVPVIGHSMGAFVAVLLAATRPELVTELVLIDGGFPLDPPAGIPEHERAAVVLGPAVTRLTTTFPSREAYRDFWRAHPAFADGWTDDIRAYADYDLGGQEPSLRPVASLDAVSVDSLELYGPDWYLDALRGLRMPVTVLRAPLGLQAEPPGLYPPGRLDAAVALVPQLRVIEVPDVNHYTIVMTEPGASTVAAVMRESLEEIG